MFGRRKSQSNIRPASTPVSAASAAAMEQLAAAKNASPSPAILPGVGKVDMPQKSIPSGMPLVPDVKPGGSISIDAKGMPQFSGPAYAGTPASPGAFKKGGKVSSASARADGVAKRGKTKGRML